MKKYLWLLLLLPVVLYFFGIRKEEIEIASSPALETLPTKPKSNKLFLSKRETPMAVKIKSDFCSHVSSQLDNIDFNQDVKDWLSLLKKEDFQGCDDPELKERVSLIINNCFAKKLTKDDCFTNLIMFRSIMRARNIKDPSTRSELADLIMAEFSKKEPDFKKLKDFSGELLKSDPNDKPVQKVWAMSAVINGDPKKLSPELIDEIYKTIDPEEMMNDPELRSLDVILKTKLKPDNVESYTRDNLKNNPKDISSREMLGWSLWQQGRRDEAIAEVDAILAIKKEPYLVALRKKLTDPSATKDSYPGRMSLGIRLEDLWN